MMFENHISVSEKVRIAYFPRELVNAGFKGKIPYLKSKMAILLLNPNATFDEVEKSVQVILEEIRLRKSHTEKARG
jgi:predicted Zn-dependent peptidase